MPWDRAATWTTAGVLIVLGVLLIAAPEAIPGLTVPGDGGMAMPDDAMGSPTTRWGCRDRIPGGYPSRPASDRCRLGLLVERPAAERATGPVSDALSEPKSQTAQATDPRHADLLSPERAA